MDPTSDTACTAGIDYAEARQIALRVAARYLPADCGESEDVAQSVLLKLFTAPEGSVRDWRAWVNRVARNLAIDRVRQWRPVHRGREIDPSAPPRSLTEVGPSGRAMWPGVWAELTKELGEREREMLLASLDGASNEDIAADFGYAGAGSAAVTLHRIRGKLRRTYADREVMLALLGVQRIY